MFLNKKYSYFIVFIAIALTLLLFVFYGEKNEIKIFNKADGTQFFMNNVEYKFVEQKLKNSDFYTVSSGAEKQKIALFGAKGYDDGDVSRIKKYMKKRGVFVADFEKIYFIEYYTDSKKIYMSRIKDSNIRGDFFTFDIINNGVSTIYNNFFFLKNFELDFDYIKQFPIYEHSSSVRDIKKLIEQKIPFSEVFNIKSFAKIIAFSLQNDDASLIKLENLFFYYSPKSRKIEPAILFLGKKEPYARNNEGSSLVEGKIFSLLDYESKKYLAKAISVYLREKSSYVKFKVDWTAKKTNSAKKDFVKAEHVQDGKIGYIRIKNYLNETIELVSTHREKLLYPVFSKPVDILNEKGEKIYLWHGAEKKLPFNWLRMSRPYVKVKLTKSGEFLNVFVKPSFENFDYKKYPYLYECESCLLNLGNKLVLKDGIYKIEGVLEVPKDMILELSPGVRFEFYYKGGIDVKGTLIARGSADKKVVFEAENSTSNYNVWQFFKVRQGAKVLLNNVEIIGLNGAETKGGAAIDVYKALFNLKNSKIKDIQGKTALLSYDSVINVENSQVENVENSFMIARDSKVGLNKVSFSRVSQRTGDALIYKDDDSKVELNDVENKSYAKEIFGEKE
jgi:hypothetical protein